MPTPMFTPHEFPWTGPGPTGPFVAPSSPRRRSTHSPVTGSSQYSNLILNTPGLVSYWRLSEASGTTAIDWMGINDGRYTTPGNITYAQPGALPTDSDYSVTFGRGSGSYITVSDSPSLNLYNTYSIEAWVKYQSTANGGGIVSKGATRVNYLLELKAGTSANVRFWADNTHSLTSTGFAAPDIWTHIVVTYDGATVRLYLQGNQDSTLTFANAAATQIHDYMALLIGAEGDTVDGSNPTLLLGAGIDEVAVYNTTLSVNQVNQHFVLGSILPTKPRSLPRRLGPKAVGPTYFASIPPKITTNQYASPQQAYLTFPQEYPSSAELWPSVGLFPLGVDPLLKQTGALTPATLSFTGTISRFTSQVLAAILSFVGNLNKLTVRATTALTATLGFVGSIAKTANLPLVGVLSFAGAMVRQIGNAMTATLSFAGSLPWRLARALSGSLSFGGAFLKGRNFNLAGALSFVGSATKQTNLVLAGVSSFAGSQVRRITKILNAVLPSVGSLPWKLSRTLTAAVLSFTGAFFKSRNFNLPGGTLSFAGNATKRTSRTLSAALSFTGAQIRTVIRSITGSLALAGGFLKVRNFKLSGALSFTGGAARGTAKALGAIGSFVGNLIANAPHGTVVNLVAQLSFNGQTTRLVTRPLRAVLSFTARYVRPYNMIAALSFVGQTTKRMPRFFIATLSLTGRQTRRTTNALTSFLTFSSTNPHFMRRSMTGVQSFTGIFVKRTIRILPNAALNLATSMRKATGIPISAGLTYVSTNIRKVSRTFTGNLSLSGVRKITHLISLNAILSTTAAIRRQINRPFSAALIPLGVLKQFSKRVMGSIWKRNTPSHLYDPTKTSMPFIIVPGGGRSHDDDNLFDPTITADDPDPAIVSMPDWTAHLYEIDNTLLSPFTYPALPSMFIVPIDEDGQDPTEEK